MLNESHMGLPGSSAVKKPPAVQEIQETWVRSLGWKEPWSRKRQPAPVSLPGKSLGRRSLAGYSPWGHKELDTIEATESHALTLTLSFPQIVGHGPRRSVTVGGGHSNSECPNSSHDNSRL